MWVWEVHPADVSYDTQYDGLSKGGEATASAKLSRMLRQEAAASRRPLSRESADEASRRAVPFRQAATEGVHEHSEKPRATSQSRREKRPKLAASRSYQKIHVSPRRSEPDPEILPADQLDSPKAPGAEALQALQRARPAPVEDVTGHLEPALISTPGRRDKMLPAAAIPAPGAGKLRSRTAWKKALVAAHQARATLAELETRQELLTPPKLSRDKEATRAVFNEEAAITLELDKLQLLQDQQEKKLQLFLESGNLISSLSHLSAEKEISMGRRLSLPADVIDRRAVSKLDLARDAAKLASQNMARDVRPLDLSAALDSPSGPLRATAASACDHAGLETLEPLERQVKSFAASRPSPRRKDTLGRHSWETLLGDTLGMTLLGDTLGMTLLGDTLGMTLLGDTLGMTLLGDTLGMTLLA
eukprot:s143_g14.t1